MSRQARHTASRQARHTASRQARYTASAGKLPIIIWNKSYRPGGMLVKGYNYGLPNQYMFLDAKKKVGTGEENTKK